MEKYYCELHSFLDGDENCPDCKSGRVELPVKPASGGQITRPNIKDFFPDKTLQEMMLIYKNNESLFNYIKKLDAYIDELESRLSV